MHDIKVGQKLFFVLNRNKAVQGEVTVLAVGRKWLKVDGIFRGNLYLQSLVAESFNGHASPGRAYLTRNDWLNVEAPRKAYGELRALMPLTCPVGLSIDAISQAARLLGIELPENIS